MPNPFDAHCHFFNIQYLFRELLTMAWDALTGNYPYPKSMLPDNFKAAAPKIDFWGLIKCIVSLLSNMTDSPEEIYANMKTAFGKNWPDSGPLAAVPLMMDIYYAFDNGSVYPPDVNAMREEKAPPLTAALKEEFDKQADAIKKMLLTEVRAKSAGNKADAGLENRLNATIREFRGEFLSGDRLINKSVRGGTVLSWGYKKHMEDLEAMKAKPEYKDLVFPFLAVDPRRPGIMDLVKNKVGPGKPFAGIKLYPPLGYLPSYPKLTELYEYCAGNIPVTFHCADGPIHTFCKTMTIYSEGSEPYQKQFNSEAEINNFFAVPGNWTGVFGKHPSLKVDFAHFGGYNEMKKLNDPEQWKTCWTKKIIDMIKDNPQWNIYTDISAYPQDDAPGLIDAVWRNNPELLGRLMFGSDYIIELFLGKTLMDYYKNFKAGLDADLVDASVRNAAGFLKP